MPPSSSAAVQILVVSEDPGLLDSLESHLGTQSPSVGGTEAPRYRLQRVTSRTEFLRKLAHSGADAILIENDRASGLSLDEVLAATGQMDRRIPIVMLDSGHKPPAIRLMKKGGTEHLHTTDLERLPRVLARLMGKMDPAPRPSIEEIRQNSYGIRENQKLLTIGRLVGSIAHEINNPLESVANLLFLMQRDPSLSPAATEYLAMAQQELNRAIQISKQTLNFYRESPDPVPVRMSSLLEEVLVLYNRRLLLKHMTVVRQFESDDEVLIYPGAMRQVFSNLIGNAIEACSPMDKLFLRIRKSRLWTDPKITGLRITVADTGSGMSAEVRRRAGEPLFTTKGQEGTGLGLWVTQSIVRGYGGDLLLRSSTGEKHGSVFTVFLPINLRPRALDSERPLRAGGERQRHEGRPGGGGRTAMMRSAASRLA